MNDHLPVEELAAYAAGELDAVAAVPVEAHVVLCAECRADVAALRRTAAALADVAPVTMPADVAARLDAAVAAERAAVPVAPLGTVLPMRRRSPYAAVVASAAALALIVVAGLGVLRSQGERKDSGLAGAGAGGRGRQVLTSGFEYTRANLAGTVPVFLRGGTPEELALTSDSARNSADVGAPTSDRALVPKLEAADPLARLQGAGLEECLTALRADGPAVAPLLLDYARWHGEPALVVVFPRVVGSSPAPDQVDVFVVGPACGADDAIVLDFQRLRITPR